MDFNKAALEMHETHHGKVGIVSKVEVKNRDQLATAYTPGVANPAARSKRIPTTCTSTPSRQYGGRRLQRHRSAGSGRHRPKGRSAGHGGQGGAVQGVRRRGCFPICIDAHDAASVIAACKAIAPTFGGINLEDIKSPECFEIEETLERELDIPVFHDDQHGTAIVVTAALINAAGGGQEDGGRPHRPERPRRCRYGHYQDADDRGAKDIIAVDQFGTLYKGCNSAEVHKTGWAK